MRTPCKYISITFMQILTVYTLKQCVCLHKAVA